MWQKFKNYLRSESRGLLLALLVSVLIVLGFAAYLKWVGLPMTSARNEYNQGMILYAGGDKVAAHKDFTASLQDWNTPEATKMELQTR